MTATKKIKAVSAILLLYITAVAYASEYRQIRFVSVLPTKYFDIIFPKECTYTAQLIAQHGDELYEKACSELKLTKKFRIPVVISPDSDVMSVSYTASPYNRIVIYDALPGDDTAYYGNTLLNEFNREVVRAVSLSLRTPFWQAVSTFISVDALQPAYLLNMPLSFVEGVCATAGEDDMVTLLDDRALVQLLSQAKLEDKFPSWMQASGARDIYPGKALAQAAGTAFAAYLQQRYGMQQYVNYWHAAGEVHLFSLTAGIFKTVYNEDIWKVWNDFKDTVPLPSDITNMELLDSRTAAVFPAGYDGLPACTVSGQYGTIWYDKARHEVDMLIPGREKCRLFIASDVTHLSLSHDGQYLAVTYVSQGCRDKFLKYHVRIYNVPGRTFLRFDYQLRDACIMKCSGDTIAVAGIYSYTQYSELRVYKISADTKDCITYSRPFSADLVPCMTVSPSLNTVSCLLVSGKDKMLFMADISDGKEQSWLLPYMITGMQCSDDRLLFTYLPEGPGSFSRLGYIQLNGQGVPLSILLQNSDVSGGVHDPSLQGNLLTYSAHKASCIEMRSVPVDDLPFTSAEIVKNESAVPSFAAESVPVIEKKSLTDSDGITKRKKFLGEYQLKEYNPFPYMFRGTWIPMLPLYKFSVDDSEYQLAPGIGVTYLTQSDPIDSTEGVLSFSTAFADPATNYQTFNDDYTFSAYMKNSSLPVDISLGGTWQFTKDGDYTLQTICAAQWLIPLDMNYQNLKFTAKQLLTLSTSYTDTDTEITEKKSGWTPLWDSYQDNCFSLAGTYSNYHQAGISAYEQLGFETSLTLVLDYDAQKTVTKDDGTTDPSKISFVINMGVKLPHLLPFPYLNNFVLDMPLTLHSQWYGSDGTSCESYAEVLIVGWESQFGIPVLNVYMTRMGLKAGYDMQLNYNTVTLPEPDLRNSADYIEVLKEGTLNDYVYLTTDAVFSPVVGFMTSFQITAGVQYRYYLRDNTFRLAAVIKAKI
jgi:hypothetical protein